MSLEHSGETKTNLSLICIPGCHHFWRYGTARPCSDGTYLFCALLPLWKGDTQIFVLYFSHGCFFCFLPSHHTSLLYTETPSRERIGYRSCIQPANGDPPIVDQDSVHIHVVSLSRTGLHLHLLTVLSIHYTFYTHPTNIRHGTPTDIPFQKRRASAHVLSSGDGSFRLA